MKGGQDAQENIKKKKEKKKTKVANNTVKLFLAAEPDLGRHLEKGKKWRRIRGGRGDVLK